MTDAKNGGAKDGPTNGPTKLEALTPASMAIARARLATLPGRKKLDYLWEQADPKAFVRRLPAEDLYFAIREIGPSDSAEIIALASGPQFRTFVDLDAWDEGQLVPSKVLEWLRYAESGGNLTTLREKRRALDAEAILIVLKSMTVVHPLEEGVDPVLSSSNWVRSAEGKYIIEITDDGDDGLMARRMILDFIDENPFEATRLFEAVRWELASELEETAARWRIGRMRDLGFPEFEEAIRIWQPLPVTWKPHDYAPSVGAVTGVPALLLHSSRAPLFLDRAAERLPDEHRTTFNEGLIYLLNCAIVADGIDPKDLDLARGSLAAARDTLSLGLELVSGGDEDVAAGILGTTPPTELFRWAVTQLGFLGRRAAQVAQKLQLGSQASTRLDSPDAELLDGLRRRRPKLYDPATGTAKRSATDWRAIRDRADLANADALLVRADALAALAAATGLDGDAFARLADAAGRSASAMTLGQVFSTSAVRAALGLPPELAPLGKAEAGRLCTLFANGRLTDDAAGRIASHFDAMGAKLEASQRAAVATTFAGWRGRLEEEIGAPCAAGGVDPRFVEAVLFTPDLTAE